MAIQRVIRLLFVLIPVFVYLPLLILLKTDLIDHIHEEKDFKVSIERVKTCDLMPKKNECIYRVFDSIAKSHKLPFTLSLMNKLQLDSQLENCHFISHIIGHDELSKNPGNWKELLTTTNPYRCGGGFLHGIVEELIEKNHTGDINQKLFSEICDYAESYDEGLNCIHTMGHLLILENGDLLKSIHECQQFIPGIEGKSYQCYHGLFMEYTTKLNLRLHNLSLGQVDVDNHEVQRLKQTCQQLTNLAEKSCWEQLSRYYLIITKNDVHTAFLLCGEAKKTLDSNACREYLGNLVVVNPKIVKSDSLGAIRIYCQQYVSLDERNSCSLHLIGILLSESITLAPKLISFCNSSEKSFQHACFLMIGNMLSLSVSPREVNDYCSKAPVEYMSECRFSGIFKSSS